MKKNITEEELKENPKYWGGNRHERREFAAMQRKNKKKYL